MTDDPRRVVAWCALSELFLDTELDDRDITRIATALRATGYSLAELQHIYEEEVAPACWRNLEALPGGVSTGFEERWLVDAITAQRGRGRLFERVPGVRRMKVRRWTALSRDDWERVARAMA